MLDMPMLGTFGCAVLSNLVLIYSNSKATANIMKERITVSEILS